MAASLVESLGADFDPSQFHDDYRDAVEEMIERKRTTGESRPAPVATAPADESDSMTDLLSALQASVDAARSKAGGGDTPAEEKPAAKAEEKPRTAPTRVRWACRSRSSSTKKPRSRRPPWRTSPRPQAHPQACLIGRGPASRSASGRAAEQALVAVDAERAQAPSGDGRRARPRCACPARATSTTAVISARSTCSMSACRTNRPISTAVNGRCLRWRTRRIRLEVVERDAARPGQLPGGQRAASRLLIAAVSVISRPSRAAPPASLSCSRISRQLRVVQGARGTFTSKHRRGACRGDASASTARHHRRSAGRGRCARRRAGTRGPAPARARRATG